jgi:hypothetical protein
MGKDLKKSEGQEDNKKTLAVIAQVPSQIRLR